MSRPCIVLADDYEPLAAACEALLLPEHDVIEVVTSGEAALAAVRQHDPDVVVLDVSMSGLSGVDVARELTRRGARAKIVMLSFERDSAIIDQAFAAGAIGYVIKTRIARDLIAAVEAALAGEPFLSRIDRGDASSPLP